MIDKETIINLLFICSRNQWRSPTAEHIWRNHPYIQTRSAGTSPAARKKISVADIHWADVIMVMEYKHQQRLQAKFNTLLRNKTIHVLDIPDQYRYGDPELIEELKQRVTSLLDLD